MTDAEAIKDLLLWARDQRIRLHQATVGAVTVVFDDQTLTEQLAAARPKSSAADAVIPTHDDALRRYGGNLIAQLEEKAGATGAATDANTTYLDEEDA